MFLWIPSRSMECPEGVLWFSKAVLMNESCMSRGILLMQYQGRWSLCAMWMCGPKKARSQFPRERMALASFGFLGVSARPPRTKNWVLVISMFWNCL